MPKAPFKVITYLRVLGNFFAIYLPTYSRTFSVDNVGKNCNFLNQLPTPMSYVIVEVLHCRMENL